MRNCPPMPLPADELCTRTGGAVAGPHRGLLVCLLILAALSSGGCYLTARGGRELDFLMFLPGVILMVVGIRVLMARMGGPLPAWRRFLDGAVLAILILIG